MQAARVVNWHCSAWTYLLLVFTACPSICLSVMIREQPVNATVLEGGVASFRCGVVEKRTIDIVFWKKVTKNDFATILSYNAKITNGTKYSVDRYYTLTIRQVGLEDEAWYECQAGKDRTRAMLTVNVMMTNMTLFWQHEPPFTKQMMVNLTCITVHSRPPADITWYHGVNEITGLGSSCKKTTDQDGFGDTLSSVTILVGATEDLQPYQCVATLPNTEVKRSEITYASMAQGYTGTSGSDMKTYHNLFWTLIILTNIIQ